MGKFNIIQLFYIFGIICLVKTQEPETLDENKVTQEYAEKSLKKIQRDEALPMVLMKHHRHSTNTNKLLIPRQVERVVLLGGKMIHGTDFYSNPSFEQMFFCPEENSEKKCLIPKTFTGIQRLQCALEATPDIQSEDEECGHDKMSTFYTSLYSICENAQYQFATNAIPLYRICYNKKLQKTLFTTHIINSPKLLGAKLLLREREVKYTMMEMEEFSVFSSQEPNDVKVKEESISPYSATKPGYQWQKLVPSEDMALALWRKTTFQRINTALQHEQLISLWDKITKYVRTNAIKMFDEIYAKTLVFTGIFDVDSAHKVDDAKQLSNIWVKLVLTSTSIFNDASHASHGVAILMNNFVDADSKALEEYCDQDLCIDTFLKEFKEVKGHVRCCLANKKILDLFIEIDVDLKELYIPNVNIFDGVESLDDDLNLFPEEAAQLIGEIKANEILPLILISNTFDSELKVPKKIRRILTKNKKIVNGSEFFKKNFEQQLFFCPKENSDDHCLAPRTFGRFQLLQCTKEATPVVRQSHSLKKCGIDDSGILYEVVYEICPAQQPYQYQKTRFKLYEFCYDSKRQNISYVRHKIKSEKVLNSKLLFREREVEYLMTAETTPSLSNYQKLVESTQTENENSTSSTDTKKSPYKPQKLVPSEDMAFALWKKSTYRYENVALQHERLIPLWNDINKYIRDHASSVEILNASYIDPHRKYFKYHYSENYVYTGVVYKEFLSVEDADQVPEIWFKVIHTEKSISYDEGVVILMNNFLIPETDDLQTSNAEANILEKYCRNNLCHKKLQNEFIRIRGQIHCCTLTIEIAQLLGIPNIDHNYVLLPIHGITE